MDQADFVHLVRLSEHASAENSRAYRRGVAAFAALGYAWVLTCLLLAGAWHRLGRGGDEWQTVLFSAIGFAQIGQAWGLRALTDKSFRFGRNPALFALTFVTLVLQLGVIYIRPLAEAFKLSRLSPEGLAATAALGALTFVIVHLERRFHRKR